MLNVTFGVLYETCMQQGRCCWLYKLLGQYTSAVSFLLPLYPESPLQVGCSNPCSVVYLHTQWSYLSGAVKDLETLSFPRCFCCGDLTLQVSAVTSSVSAYGLKPWFCDG